VNTRTIALLIPLFAIVASSPASADPNVTINVTIDKVQYRTFTATPDLIAFSGSVGFWATVGTSPGCSVLAPSLDTLKIWASLFQEALLSGKFVSIHYTPCNNINWIQAVMLQRVQN